MGVRFVGYLSGPVIPCKTMGGFDFYGLFIISLSISLWEKGVSLLRDNFRTMPLTPTRKVVALMGRYIH